MKIRKLHISMAAFRLFSVGSSRKSAENCCIRNDNRSRLVIVSNMQSLWRSSNIYKAHDYQIRFGVGSNETCNIYFSLFYPPTSFCSRKLLRNDKNFTEMWVCRHLFAVCMNASVPVHLEPFIIRLKFRSKLKTVLLELPQSSLTPKTFLTRIVWIQNQNLIEFWIVPNAISIQLRRFAYQFHILFHWNFFMCKKLYFWNISIANIPMFVN